MGTPSRPFAPPRRCWIDMNSASDQADRGPRQGPLQKCLPRGLRPSPHPAPPAGLRACRVPPVPHGRSGRSPASEAADGFPRANRRKPPRQTEARRFPGIGQSQITRRTIGQHLHRRIRPRQPGRQPRQVPAIAALLGQRRHHSGNRGRVKLGSRLVGSSAKAIWPCSASRQAAILKFK